MLFVGDDWAEDHHDVELQDESGRRRPVEIPGSEFVLPVDTVVKAIGQQAHTGLFKLFGLELQSSNVRVDPDRRTSRADTFAGGDCIAHFLKVFDRLDDDVAHDYVAPGHDR